MDTPPDEPCPDRAAIAYGRPDQALATRVATAPGLVRAGAGSWDGTRTPIMPLAIESAYADPVPPRRRSGPGARGSPASWCRRGRRRRDGRCAAGRGGRARGRLPFAFVRKPGYRGHEPDEPQVRGADIAGRRVLLVDDAISSGAAVERFSAALARAGAEVAGVFVIVDMRDIAKTVSSVAEALPTESVARTRRSSPSPPPAACSIPPSSGSASTRS